MISENIERVEKSSDITVIYPDARLPLKAKSLDGELPMIDWEFNFDEAPRTGEPVLIWYNGAAWHSEWNRLDNRWSCLKPGRN